MVKPIGERLVRAVERQAWLDKPSYKLEHSIALVFNALGDVSRPVRDLLHGTWWGHPVHPMLTDVPVGAWTATLALDMAGSARGRGRGHERAARTTVGIGIVGAVAAAVTGLTDWQYTQDNARRVGLVHGSGNAVVLGVQVFSWRARRRGQVGRGRVFSGLAYAGLLVTAYLGGTLVYRERIGPAHGPDELWPRTFTRAARFEDLPDGRPRRVDVDGVSVVLVRRGEEVSAVAARCSHQGGPLGEGWLQHGELVCPWHGSAFDLQTGEVRRGPATAPLPRYAVRRVDGWVELRRRPFDTAAPPGRAIAWQQQREDAQ